ncbi:hypothetical protein QQS21_003102 [Conoideocrella luteorostrata]|uniref:Uncharacterized protein n=1 Tax=Conoideocrella luteorostrata TaxID=1105319 RepID=A0AAJ0CU43_9HYPO|nr:hypothetical protein QQS21_003102 [Conoideocrella luteorostrata]
MVGDRRAAEILQTPGYKRDDDFLQLMMNAADAAEGLPETLAHRQLLMALAAIHTTILSATNAMFDLCTNQEFIPPFRYEIMQVLAEEAGWQKSTMTKVHSLDSCMKESQRMNPQSQRKLKAPSTSALRLKLRYQTVAFSRLVRQPVTLSDFKYPDGLTRPKPLSLDRHLFPDRTAELLMRRRETE